MAETRCVAWGRDPIGSSVVAEAVVSRARALGVRLVSVAHPGGQTSTIAPVPATVRSALERVWRTGGLVDVTVGESVLRVRQPVGAAPAGVDVQVLSPTGSAADEVVLLRWLRHLGVMAGFVDASHAVSTFGRSDAIPEPPGRRKQPVEDWTRWEGLTAATAEEWLLATKIACLRWHPRSDVGRVGHRPGDSSSAISSAAFDIPSYLAPPAAKPAHVPPEESRDETAALDFSALRAALTTPATPFTTSASVSVPPPRAAFPVERENPATGDETMALPLGALLATDGGAVGVRVAFVPELSVDQYAALVVELEVKGPTADVLRRYGIPTTDALSALHAEQARRHGADAALAARFQDRRAHFLRFARKP